MRKTVFPALCVLGATSVMAEETRQLDAHEHGVGQLGIALEDTQIAIELRAPGADIVGFEYAAENAEDRASVDDAVALLARPLDLFVLPEAAGCSVVQASAEMEGAALHDDKDAEHDHSHDEHADHEDEDDAGHTEFHANYLLKCADPSAASNIIFAYFETFPNALKLEVKVISDTGASAFEVERDAPTLNLRGMF